MVFVVPFGLASNKDVVMVDLQDRWGMEAIS